MKVAHGQGSRRGSGRGGAGGGAIVMGTTPKGMDCPMNLIMNGGQVKLQAGETFDMFFNVNEVYAMEVYAHATDIPAAYQQLLGNDFCGAVVVWTVTRMTLKP